MREPPLIQIRTVGISLRLLEGSLKADGMLRFPRQTPNHLDTIGSTLQLPLSHGAHKKKLCAFGLSVC